MAFGNRFQGRGACAVLVLALLGVPSFVGAQEETSVAEGRVVAIDGQVLTIDLGRDDGLSVGDHIAFSTTTETDLGDVEPAVMVTLFAVGEVRAVSSHRARVRLGLNERVAIGTRARPTDAAPSRSLVAPPASSARSELAIGARLVGTLGATGGGMLMDSRLDHRFGEHVFVRLRVDPAGVVGYRPEDPDRDGPIERPPTTFAAAANVVGFVGYDTGPIAFGAGVGVTMTTRLDEHYQDCATCTPEVRHRGFEPGLAFATMARFGVRDGIFLEADTAFVTVRSRIEMSRLALKLNVPVTNALALVATGSGGFGVVGTRIIELGARTLVRGNGGRRSVFVTPHVGYAAVSERADLYATPRRQPRPEVGELVHGISAGLTLESRF